MLEIFGQNIIDPMSKLLGDWAYEINVWSILLRIGLSIVLSAILGWERASKRHSAGLRTFIIVSLASTTAMLIDVCLIEFYGLGIPLLSAAAIIGSAMVCGNSILFTSKNQIKGLTTSAGLWLCALLGLAAGAGLYTITIIGFFALIFCLSMLPSIERYLKNRSNHFEIHLELMNRSNLQDFIGTLRKLGIRIDDIELNPAYLNSGLSVYSISVTVSGEELKKYKTHKEIIEALRSLTFIHYIEEMN